MSEQEPLHWLTGIGDSKLHTAVCFEEDRLVYVIQAMSEKYAQSLAAGTLIAKEREKAKSIAFSEIDAVAKSPEGYTIRIEQAGGKKISMPAAPADSSKLMRIFDTLKSKLAPNAPLEESQATLSEALGPPTALLGLVGVFSGAIYFLIKLDEGEEGKPGRKSVAKLLYAIGYQNVLIACGSVMGLLLLWAIIRAVFRPKMQIFRVPKAAEKTVA